MKESLGLRFQNQDTVVMGALSDPKLEKFAQALLCHLASGLTAGKAATQAALEAGYSGSSVAANARKRAQRRDVKLRLIELAAPRQAEVEAEIAETMEAVTTNLFRMALKSYDGTAIKPEHSLKASDLLAKLKGWNAPSRTEIAGPDGGPIATTTSDADRIRALTALVSRMSEGTT